MNKKGFTLVELLATIVVLAVVGGIASYGVINAINKSKLKSEAIFVDKLSNLIDDYLDLYPPTEHFFGTYTFDKCKDDVCANTYEATASQVTESLGSGRQIYNPIQISDLVNANIINYEDLVNPKNKKQCFDNIYDPEIVVYKDSDYVYHYYLDLSGNNTNCDIDEENALINTLPDNLVKEIAKDTGISLPDILKSRVGL